MSDHEQCEQLELDFPQEHQELDAVQRLLALGDLPPGDFNPFDARSPRTQAARAVGSAIFRRFHVKPETWEQLNEIARRVSEGKERSVSPRQVGALLLHEAAEETLDAINKSDTELTS